MVQTRVKTFAAVMAGFAFLFFAALANAAKTTEKKIETDNMEIISERADVDMESEEFTIPGAVEIKIGDIRIKGKNLTFSNKTMIAELSGNPLTATLGTEIQAEAGKIFLDINKEQATLSGGCRFTQTRAGGRVEFESETIDTNYGEKGWARSRGEVKIHYMKIEGKDKQKAETDGAAKKPVIDTDEVFGTAGTVYYTFDDRQLEASHTVRIEIKEGAFTAAELKGNLEKEKLALSGGIQGKIKDVSFSAARMDIDYKAQETDIWGGVDVTRDSGDHFKADHVWLRYKEGARALKTSGGVQMNLKVDKEKLRKKIENEKPAPEGGKP